MTLNIKHPEVWQYGSALNCTNCKVDPLDKQDGIAPQTTVGGLDETHRVYIPNGVTKGFYESHNIENYKWIFEIKPTDKNPIGYVKKR
jgi:hypothetical protein